jgi:hypothetical protein
MPLSRHGTQGHWISRKELYEQRRLIVHTV